MRFDGCTGGSVECERDCASAAVCRARARKAIDEAQAQAAALRQKLIEAQAAKAE